METESDNFKPGLDNFSTVYVCWGYEIIEDRAKPCSGWNIDDVELNGKLK